MKNCRTIPNLRTVFPPPPNPLHLLPFRLPLMHLQALTCSPTAPRSARPWATRTAAGCRPSWPPTGARGPTTAATCTCPAWTPRCPTLRYPLLSTCPTNSPPPRPPPRATIGHSPPLARTVRGHSHTTAFTITSIRNSRSTAPARWRGKSMIGGPYRTNPPFSVSISMKTRWDPTTLVWSSTDTNERKEGILIWTFFPLLFYQRLFYFKKLSL